MLRQTTAQPWIKISHSSTIVLVLWEKCEVLQNSWTDILFIRGEILSSATTCDSNWSFMVPGTYWDIWIYRRGRWMAKVHDCVMWNVCVLGGDNMERKSERRRRGDEDIFEVELLLRALYKVTRYTVRSGRFLGDKRVKMGLKVSMKLGTFTRRHIKEWGFDMKRYRGVGEKGCVNVEKKQTIKKMARDEGSRRKGVRVWQDWVPPVLHERE